MSKPNVAKVTHFWKLYQMHVLKADQIKNCCTRNSKNTIDGIKNSSSPESLGQFQPNLPKSILG